jgi:hypothetical protein
LTNWGSGILPLHGSTQSPFTAFRFSSRDCARPAAHTHHGWRTNRSPIDSSTLRVQCAFAVRTCLTGVCAASPASSRSGSRIRCRDPHSNDCARRCTPRERSVPRPIDGEVVRRENSTAESRSGSIADTAPASSPFSASGRSFVIQDGTSTASATTSTRSPSRRTTSTRFSSPRARGRSRRSSTRGRATRPIAFVACSTGRECTRRVEARSGRRSPSIESCETRRISIVVASTSVVIVARSVCRGTRREGILHEATGRRFHVAFASLLRRRAAGRILP